MAPASLWHSWSLPPVVTLALVLSAVFYLRGWWIVRDADESLLPFWRAGVFLSGLGFIWIALASPLDALNELLLTAHMLQHMLLMMVAPPLILLGAPLIPFVRGLPGRVVRRSIGSFLNWPAAERIGHVLANPIAGALAMGLVMFVWHTPRVYELALRSEGWHEVEHTTFFFVSLMFWWPVVLPWPSRGQWPRWAIVPYLLVADLQNTALSAILAFSDRVLYRSYADAPRLFALSALQDQVAAGAFMWVAGSVAFIVPAIGVAVQCLSTRSTRDVMSHIATSGS
jgi:cytochrome c oxidase assembly factor CtaG